MTRPHTLRVMPPNPGQYSMVLVCDRLVKTSMSCNQSGYEPGGVLPIMAYTGRLRPKGYLFQASGI